MIPNATSILTGIAAALFALAGAFFTGFDYGKSHTVAAESANVLDGWKKSFDAATKVAQDFTALATEYTSKIEAQKSTNTERKTKAQGVIHARPLPPTVVLDPELVQLRCSAIQDLYTAAGRAVPGSCVRGATPAPAAAGKQPP